MDASRLPAKAGRTPASRAAVLPALAIFFASGAAALVYQVAWQRMLVIFSGADVHAATIVVAAFMAGLGCGSLGGGQLADRVSRRTSLSLFAAAELCVAGFGLVSPPLFYDFLYRQLGQVQIGLGATALVLMFALLWPTFLMGASLPLLARGLTHDVRRAASTVGWLYGANTLGAAAGAVATTWLLLPQAGITGAVRAAALLNIACAAAAIALAQARQVPRDETASTAETSEAAGAGSSSRLPVVAWAGLFAVSGFIGLSLEIVWFRMLGVLLKSTAFTFGTLLAVYLAGIGLGAAAGAAVAARVRRPALGFFALQFGSGAYAALSLAVVVALLGRARWMEWFVDYFGGNEAIDIRAVVDQIRYAIGVGAAPGSGGPEVVRLFVRLYVLLPAALIGPPTFMAGFAFPLLQRAVHTDLAHVGRRVGTLLAANILGSTLGAFVTGWVLLDHLGTPGTVRLVFLLSAGFGVLAVRELTLRRRAGARAAAYAGGALIVAGVAVAMPPGTLFWARLHGTTPSRVIVDEDGSGLAVLKADRPDFGRVVVVINGLGQSWIPYGGVHTVLGALPAFAHPNPRSAAVIGLGSGDTLFGLAGRRELERITSIEIIAPQLVTLRALSRTNGYPGVRAILADRRIEHVSGDGRLYLRRAGRKYDIIEADALYPTSAYSGNLYSDAYFRLLRDHLNPGGLAVTWAPTARVVRTFRTVFPYVWHAQAIMIGSDAPIDMNGPAIRARLGQPEVASHFALSGVDIATMLEPYLAGPVHADGQSSGLPDRGDINTDLRPRDEFDIPPLIPLPLPLLNW
ncbi:MAG: fused MFS/spermidine synthase [Acidobacteriota bacterium]